MFSGGGARSGPIPFAQVILIGSQRRDREGAGGNVRFGWNDKWISHPFADTSESMHLAHDSPD